MINKLFGKYYKKLDGNTRLERMWLLSKMEFFRRYKEGFLGVIWAALNPLFRMTIYYFVFSVVMTSDIDNFALYLMSGFLIWMFFAQASKQSLLIYKRNKYLIDNIRFNKLDLFFSSLLGSLYGFFFSFLAYFLFTFIASIQFDVNLIYILLWFPLLIVTILGINLIISTIGIFISDINQLWDLILLAGFWTAPIFFRGEAISEKFPLLFYANPMSGLIINIRNAILYSQPPDWGLGLYNFIYTSLLLGIGLLLFNRFSHKAIEKL